jgi:hypothetical protein
VTKTPKNRYGGSNTGSVGANAYVRNTGGNAHTGNASGNADALAGTNNTNAVPTRRRKVPQVNWRKILVSTVISPFRVKAGLDFP